MLRISLVPLRIVFRLVLLGSLLTVQFAVAAQSPDFSRFNIERLLTRMEEARRDQDHVSYVAAITTYARKFSSQLQFLDSQDIRLAFQRWDVPASRDAMIGMYEALFAANWKLDGIEPSHLQGTYIRLMVDQQQWSRATEVVQRLRDPRLALELKSDRRADPLIEAHPENFDIDALIGLQIAEREAVVQQLPKRWSVWNSLFSAYRDAGRYRQILAVSDQLLAMAEGADSASKNFEDPENLNWVHDQRARAWMGLGDWAAAEREFRLAANLPERANVNISNTLNLANLLAEKGDEEAALKVLASLPNGRDSATPYGRMTEMRARHIAAHSSQDRAAASKALEYLRKNRDIAPDMLLEALVREERFDEAAAELDRRLADPELRWDALAFVQQYSPAPHMLPSQLAYLRSLEAWLGREDVRRAINKVGRIERTLLQSSWL